MTLTELSYYSRRFLPFIILGFIFILILFYFFKLIFLIFSSSPKSIPIYQNPIFGKIKKPLVKDATNSASFNYILDTIEGVPITATESAKVYSLLKKNPSFSYREKAFLIAKKFGFDTEIVNYKLENNQAIFTDDKQELTIDITNFNFFYQYFFDNEFSLFDEVNIPERKEIENKAVAFLKDLNQYPEELALGRININLLKYDYLNKSFIKIDKPKDANAVEVNFFRPDIDNFSIITANFPSSHNYLLLVFKNNDLKILRAKLNFFEKFNDEYGVYLLNSGEKVWEKLKKGEGIVINAPKDKETIIIKKMFLGYFDPDIYQEYLQPVYVFVGEPDFTAFVPAIIDEYLE